MQKYKNIGLTIVILVIGFNAYDYFKVKSNLRGDDIEKCSEKFRSTNPDINKKSIVKENIMLLINCAQRFVYG